MARARWRIRPAWSLRPTEGAIYLDSHYAQDTVGQNVIATVHIEALWDGADDPINETRWLESLNKT